jgi:hypothetical protein
MGNVFEKFCRENQNTYFVLSNPPPRKLNTFRKRVKNVVTSKGIKVGIEYE